MISPTRRIGNIGEKVAENFLKRKGYLILERNYSKYFGELDLIAQKDGAIIFVEVKTAREGEGFRAEQNITLAKQKRLIKTAQVYLLEKKYPVQTEWQIDAIIVELASQPKITHLTNIVWG